MNAGAHGLRAALARAWACWKVVAHHIGNFQARLLLSVVYFVIVPPFAVTVKIFRDPLALRAPRGESFGVVRQAPDDASRAGRRQFWP